MSSAIPAAASRAEPAPMGSNRAGTLERLAVELGRALEPLEEALDPGFFVELGVDLPREIADDPDLLSSLDAARGRCRDLRSETAALAAAMTAGDETTIASAGAGFVAAFADLVRAFTDLGAAVLHAADALPPDGRAVVQDLAIRLPRRITEAMLVSYLAERWPSLTAAGELLALLEGAPRPETDLEVIRAIRPVAPRLHIERVPQLLFRPEQHLKDSFGWGAPDFDGAILLQKVQLLLESLGVPAAIFESLGGPPSLEAFVFAARADGSVSPPGLIVEVALPGDVTFDDTIDFSDLWKGTVHVEANYAAGLDVLVRPPLDITLRPPSGTVAVKLQLGLKAERTDPLALFGVTGGLALQAKSVAVSIGANASLDPSGGVVTPTIQLRVNGGRLVLNGSNADGFLQDVFGGRSAELAFDIGADWNPREGLRLQGSAGGESFIPASADLSVARLDGIYLSVGLASGGGVAIAATSRVSARLGPVAASIDRVGLAASIGFPQSGGNLGVADLDVGFKPPSGIGMSVDAQGVVTGGGFLFHDESRQLYAGVMQLTVQERITLKAFGLISTVLPDGRPGYSLIIFITAEDFRPIPLGLGFTLLGIGGMVAVNRTFDQEVLRQGLKAGTLAALLFPRDPVANAAALIQSLASAFPARRGSYLFGVLAKIGWFTPTLVLMDLALILEFGARKRLLALGRISALLPSPDNDLVRLNMDAMGVLDLDAGTAAVDAVLIDSRLAKRFVLTGAAALRAGFGSGSGSTFVLAVGGLNPHFAPPAGLPALDRVALALSSGDNPRLLCEAYFAITANTLQFGARASLYASAIGFSVQGDIGFDVLVEMAPLHFIADYHASVQLKRGSHNLFAIELAGSLEGPRPLRVSGKATFKILWCHFSVRFDAALVKGDPPPLPPAVDVLAQLRQALAAPQSWSTRRTAGPDHGVALRTLAPAAAGSAMVLDPLGRLAVTQQVAPLNTARDVEIFGGAPVAGARRFRVSAALNGTPQSITPVRESFAPAQYFTMSDDEKLAAPSFETMDAGCLFGSDDVTFDAGQIIAAPLEYDTVVIRTSGASPGGRPLIGAVEPAAHVLTASQLGAFARTGAAARATVRRTGRARFRNDTSPSAARFDERRWAIVPTAQGAPASVDPAVRTWSEYQGVLQRLNRAGARWQLVPAYELS